MKTLAMVRGDTRTFDFSVAVGSGGEFDLTDATVEFTVDDLFTKTQADGIDVDEDTGSIIATIVPADTEDHGWYRTNRRYAVRITDADGVVTTIARGHFVVVPDLDRVEG